ncbi:DoxX family protein [Xanthobacteraceae bacterium A53D]
MQRLDDLALLVGRLLMAVLFLPAGVKKAMNPGGLAGMLASKGLPFPEVLSMAAAAVEIIGPILLIVGLFPRLTAVLVGGFTIVAALISHAFWTFPDAAAQAAQQIHFFKNLAIAGGMAFYFAAGPGRFALGNGRF